MKNIAIIAFAFLVLSLGSLRSGPLSITEEAVLRDVLIKQVPDNIYVRTMADQDMENCVIVRMEIPFFEEYEFFHCIIGKYNAAKQSFRFFRSRATGTVYVATGSIDSLSVLSRGAKRADLLPAKARLLAGVLVELYSSGQVPCGVLEAKGVGEAGWGIKDLVINRSEIEACVSPDGSELTAAIPMIDGSDLTVVFLRFGSGGDVQWREVFRAGSRFDPAR